MQTHIRPRRDDELDALLTIINAAAEAYRGAIPDDCWHEPYMSARELRDELDAGVTFSVLESGGAIVGLMGIQTVANVDLIRHAYVAPERQGQGIGGALLTHLNATTRRHVLIGTWSAATWAIRFYERHGFALVPEPLKTPLLRTYWTVSARQVETSVVLARPRLTNAAGIALIRAATR